ncbi:hypothetical protein P5673_023848 [Acropora cervicornis]|uniref:Uncharacterized protein n=1 Tax=Acropora cervicornis TaxID=6130 RepID=A0AAD9Q4L0_ACRCE|nr:hypothetical protein P5673_023848 [Acropora cervicornis]
MLISFFVVIFVTHYTKHPFRGSEMFLMILSSLEAMCSQAGLLRTVFEQRQKRKFIFVFL